MFRNMIATAFIVFANIICNAQSSDGTMLLDDATSRTRVVTNAFLNASNEVHELIQTVSPKADFSTNNAELVQTIAEVSPSMTTNDVCNIVTNRIDEYSVTIYNPGFWEIDQQSATFKVTDVEWIDRSTVRLVGNGVEYRINILDDSSSQTICVDGLVELYTYNAYAMIQPMSMPDSWNLDYGISSTGFDDSTRLNRVDENALGLAMANDLTNYVAKVDGKANVLNIGVNNAVTGARAAAIGTNNTASGSNAIAFGRDNVANNATTIALGRSNTASGTFAMAAGTGSVASNNQSFVWNRSTVRYGSHGTGTYNVNPQNGIYGLYIGEQNLYDAMLAAMTSKSATSISFVDDDGNEESRRTIQPVGFATSDDLNPIQNSVNAMWETMYGENVWLAVTNYMRTIAGTVPSLRLWEVRDGDTNMVYSSNEEITHIVTQKMDTCVARIEAMIPRTAWGSYQSSGEDNPSSNSVTVINSPKIMLTGGGEWYRTIETGGGSVWVLKTSGLMTAGGDTNGYFRVVDAEGIAQIEVVKTSEQIVDAIVSDVEFDSGGNFTVTFNASGSNHPIVSCADNLGDVFYEEDSSGEINALGITVSWAKDSNDFWVATIHQDEKAEHLFVYGKVKVPGTNVVRNNAPTAMDGGIYINGTRYKLVPYTTGGKTYLTLEAL